MGPNEEQNLEIRFRSDQTPSYQTHPQLVPSITRYHMKIVNEQEYYADDEETCTDTEVEDIMLRPRTLTGDEINLMRNEIRFTYYTHTHTALCELRATHSLPLALHKLKDERLKSIELS
ncbi:hypothetical protein GPJ56_002202 [Histomonas meleagridis]|nr:hypothetical protein GPJ56_002202 [Histomonas meleagridis]